MGNVSKSESKLLNELIKDCITFNLDSKEGLEYIKARLGKKISVSTYQLRKSRVLSEDSVNRFLNNYTRIGYVQNHMEAIEYIKMINRDSRAQLFNEINKKIRNERLILQIKEDIRENTKLLSELSLGTPIIAGIKAKMQRLENEKRIPVSE